jgi:hypothetical protein
MDKFTEGAMLAVRRAARAATPVNDSRGSPDFRFGYRRKLTPGSNARVLSLTLQDRTLERAGDT